MSVGAKTPAQVDAASPGEMMGVILERLHEQTGKTVAEWAATVRELGLKARKDRVEWLMREHSLGRVASNAIAAYAAGEAIDYADQDGLLDAMYAGPKSILRPIYDRLVEVGREFGPEFSLYHCSGQTTFKRGRQFAWVKASTRTRVDLGLALPGAAAGGRLLPVSGTNDKDRVRLRIALSSMTDVDAEAVGWLRRAWDLEAIAAVGRKP